MVEGSVEVSTLLPYPYELSLGVLHATAVSWPLASLVDHSAFLILTLQVILCLRCIGDLQFNSP